MLIDSNQTYIVKCKSGEKNVPLTPGNNIMKSMNWIDGWFSGSIESTVDKDATSMTSQTQTRLIDRRQCVVVVQSPRPGTIRTYWRTHMIWNILQCKTRPSCRIIIQIKLNTELLCCLLLNFCRSLVFRTKYEFSSLEELIISNKEWLVWWVQRIHLIH